ncbi:HDA5 [Symbiodinium natans]|uniref:histone deacetylase n=1 Tax=Symbiodinium natans TaxID=878477 RepID=A0A812JWG6_9DINO|nr:HDA5 [Symbiodinium natans]
MPEAGQIAAGVGPEPAEPAEPAEPEGLAGPHASASSTSSTSAQACSRACATKSWLEANNLRDSQGCVALVSDEALLLHAGPTNHPERPARLAEILKQLDLSGLQSACTKVASREATKEELLRVHTENHIERVSKSSSAKKKGKDWGLPFGLDTYANEHTPHCAVLSAGCLLALVDHCLNDTATERCGMAVIRPPGHHAGPETASGFCMFNNVAVAARHAQREHGLERVAIIDWDVHHGNGTNDVFAEDDSVLFFSLHRYDSTFFPGTGYAEDVGKSDARGYNVNVPLDKGFGDLDVAYIMRYLICPVVEKFAPQAIFISAGFDAVRGDPLGDCRVSPEGFGWMTRCLYRLARHYCQGRLFLALEGGYNPDLIAQCTVECVRTLLEEVHDLAGPDADDFVPPAPSPSCSVPGTPAMMPASPLLCASRTSEASRSSTPSLQPDGTPPASPSLSSRKARGPANKTVRVVRKATEQLHLLRLEVPLAPQGDGASKSAKRNERRKQRKNSGEEDPGASSDNSGWAIVCAGEDEFAFSPAVRVSRQVSGGSQAHVPDLELPPAMPETDTAETKKTLEVKSTTNQASSGPSKQKKKSKRK